MNLCLREGRKVHMIALSACFLLIPGVFSSNIILSIGVSIVALVTSGVLGNQQKYVRCGLDCAGKYIRCV